jgi:two-component system CheB/CheR fusion protein
VTAHSGGDGTGSEFAVRLPLTTLPEPAQTPERSPMPVPPSGTSVIVVEDNADSREMLCALLARAGLSCHGAPDGVTALRLVDEVSPSIVILDVGLPDMDGLEVARRIRANSRHAAVRLIALTGYGRTRDRVATTLAGFDHHLVKPVQPTELLVLLAEIGASMSTMVYADESKRVPSDS